MAGISQARRDDSTSAGLACDDLAAGTAKAACRTMYGRGLPCAGRVHQLGKYMERPCSQKTLPPLSAYHLSTSGPPPVWTGDLNALAYNITLKGTNELVTSVGWYLPSSAYTVDPKAYCQTNASKSYACSEAQRSRVVGGEACQWGGRGPLELLHVGLARPDHGGRAAVVAGRPAERRARPARQQRPVPAAAPSASRRLLPVRLPPSVIYDPDASHASFATWREYSYCPGDENWGAGGGAAGCGGGGGGGRALGSGGAGGGGCGAGGDCPHAVRRGVVKDAALGNCLVTSWTITHWAVGVQIHSHQTRQTL